MKHPAEQIPFRKSIFLAGGITGCPDCQAEATAMFLKETDLVIFNPRRKDFDIDDVYAVPIQINWEHTRLWWSDLILFWFPEETTYPIALYELGAWASRTRTIFVGCHKEYPRRMDMWHQLQLERPEISLHTSLTSLIRNVINFIGDHDE